MNNLDKIKNSFINSAVKHGEATEIGDHKTANKQYDVIMDSYKVLHKSEEGRKILQQLMHNENSWVQLWAATFCLQYYPDDSKRVLKSLQEKSGFIAFDAEITLQEWEKGKLKFSE